MGSRLAGWQVYIQHQAETLQQCAVCVHVCVRVCVRACVNMCMCVRERECQSCYFSCRFERTTEGNVKPPCRQLYCGGPLSSLHNLPHTHKHTHTIALQSAPHPCHLIIARMHGSSFAHLTRAKKKKS